MSKFEDRAGNPMGRPLLSAIGISIAGVLLAVWGIAVLVAIIVPGVLAAGVAAATVRWSRLRRLDRSAGPLVIEGEVEVVNPGTGTR